MKVFYRLVLLLFCEITYIVADVTITISGNGQLPLISPYIYGRNNSFDDQPEKTTPDSLVTLYLEAGVRIFRENGGNNSTKYNWRKKLSSHPDWYNNVYEHDWGRVASEIQKKVPNAQGIFALQLLGWAASINNDNFDCWDFDKCTGTLRNKNFAGGITIEEVGADTNAHGDPSHYLERWPADSTAGILQNWFSPSPAGLGLDSTRFRFWNMDNEPEVWTSTHDDIADTTLTAEQYMQLYFQVAKKARSLFPGIKLMGPVFTNEWQWWAWKNKTVSATVNGRDTSLCWAEYFIKRIADEQKSTGVRLLDVIDFHFYPGMNETSDIDNLLQLHRVFYDSLYIYPKSNGIHLVDKKWGTNVPYYIFSRVNKWLDMYLGKGHGVTIGMSEFGSASGGDNAMVNALNYASMLGTFGREGVEVFTPWAWYESWWEVLHLFSKYGQPLSLHSTSSLDSLVSAYPMIGKDTLTVILVNRATVSQKTEITLGNRDDLPVQAQAFRLANLPNERTFYSHVNNALTKTTHLIDMNKIQTELPSRSITALVVPLTKSTSSVNSTTIYTEGQQISIKGKYLAITYANSFDIFDLTGKLVKEGGKSIVFDISSLPDGVYVVHMKNNSYTERILLNR
jgi:hypothetical protein